MYGFMRIGIKNLEEMLYCDPKKIVGAQINIWV